ncbi:hypothetical protein LSTR_LSTR011358 [Laodelphax striatellus]|uniref:Uncharacterized protein n=1 Tax=Laodelphax striatellus TaxID=195883 RepID=A0A482X742_LAOST|nr:hypothetical protein LSTR_LSTR011358 [Laodelphax striatellus]
METSSAQPAGSLILPQFLFGLVVLACFLSGEGNPRGATCPWTPSGWGGGRDYKIGATLTLDALRSRPPCDLES